MRRATAIQARQWVTAFAWLAALTVVMLLFRGRLDKAHVALLYLLVVLGGSSVGGRAIGLALGGTAFLAFNFLFLPPYYAFTIGDPLDWLVLLAFLATSIVAAELLDRERRHAALADQRRAELDQLATLGAETLNAARAQQALGAIADVIRRAIGVARCELFVRGESGELESAADQGDHDSAPAGDGLLDYVVKSQRAAIVRADGTLHVLEDVAHEGELPALVAVRALAIPLTIRGETVGALRVSTAESFSLSVEQRRILNALAYYAALGIQRLRLEGAEERAESLRRTDRMKDALLAAVSHDLRTPLTTIKGIAHEIAGDGAERAAVIEREADRLSTLVDALLELSQLNAGALDVRLQLNTIDDLVGAALQRAETVLGHHPVHVDIGGEDLLVGQFDFSHSLRILVNLLENAAKYSAPDAPIELVARREGNAIAITVRDRGPGIPVSEHERIFEPFYRTPGAPADVRGAGLGLSIARRLSRAQRGDLVVTSADGRGAAFTMTVPVGTLPSG